MRSASDAASGSDDSARPLRTALFGLVSAKKDLDVKQLCPSGNVQIEDKHTFVNQLLGTLTFGIWRPTTVIVRCADGSGQMEIEVDEKLARAIVTDPLFIQIVFELYPERVPEVQMALQQLEQTSDQASVQSSATQSRF